MSVPSSTEQRLAKLREAFLRQLPAQLERIKGAYAALGPGTQALEAIQDLHRRIHTLRGGKRHLRPRRPGGNRQRRRADPQGAVAGRA